MYVSQSWYQYTMEYISDVNGNEEKKEAEENDAELISFIVINLINITD